MNESAFRTFIVCVLVGFGVFFVFQNHRISSLERDIKVQTSILKLSTEVSQELLTHIKRKTHSLHWWNHEYKKQLAKLVNKKKKKRKKRRSTSNR